MRSLFHATGFQQRRDKKGSPSPASREAHSLQSTSNFSKAVLNYTGITNMKGGTAQRKVPVEEKKRPLTLKEERDMKLAFELYDLTGCGVISKEDALNILTTLGFKVSREDTLRLNAII